MKWTESPFVGLQKGDMNLSVLAVGKCIFTYNDHQLI